ncbi:hypothetical protein [Streptomyces sp. TRM68416]|uniref:hypothetical protein n=1 Tax=Streptomyces sp. TRM68416 TaxID=2758412 RepID=UPI001CB6C987|nr:hypothetical protein [Streptomyces sp. TRM68416]
MARTATPPRWRHRAAGTAVVVTVLTVFLATAWSFGYVRLPGAPMASLSRSGEVDTASSQAKARAEHRLQETVGGLPGTPRPLGAAAADRCLRNLPFEGEPSGPLSCQWRLERYLVLDEDPRTAGDTWAGALGDARWTGTETWFPVAGDSAAERHEYRDARTHDRLVVTLVRGSEALDLLDAAPRFEGVETYEREQRSFAGRKAAGQAVAEDRTVARISLVHAYYSENGSAPYEPQYW